MGLNKIETKRTIEKIDETKSWISASINKINNPLARITKKKKVRTQTGSQLKEETLQLILQKYKRSKRLLCTIICQQIGQPIRNG